MELYSPCCAKVHPQMDINSYGPPLPQDTELEAYAPPVVAIALSRMVSYNNRHQAKLVSFRMYSSGCTLDCQDVVR